MKGLELIFVDGGLCHVPARLQGFHPLVIPLWYHDFVWLGVGHGWTFGVVCNEQNCTKLCKVIEGPQKPMQLQSNMIQPDLIVLASIVETC